MGILNLQCAQGSFQDRVLALRPSRLAQRVTVTKWHTQGARRTHPFRHLPQKLNHHGGDPATLELRCHQTHGLVAHRSHRHQHRRVHAIVNQPLGRFGRRIPDEATGRRDGTHKGEVAVVE